MGSLPWCHCTGDSPLCQAPVGPEVAPLGLAPRLMNWHIPPLTLTMAQAKIMSPKSILGPKAPFPLQRPDSSYLGGLKPTKLVGVT